MHHENTSARPVQLHVIHDLGGGSAKWLRDFCAADTARTNLVLRPYAHDVAAARGIALYAGAGDDVPMRAWKFATPIAATVPRHPEYRAALQEIIAAYAVQGLLVSSVIGHSLDVLDTGLPTAVVNHDYFPYCPAINLYFDRPCSTCDGERVAQCERDNERFNPFADFPAATRMEARERFVELVRRPGVAMVVPSRSVMDNLQRLDARFHEAAFTVIPHGYGQPLAPAEFGEHPAGDRLRVLVLGQLSFAKGLELLQQGLAEITRFADVYLLGCREVGELFKYREHVHVVSQYDLADLAPHLMHIRPHVGLLMSVVPETFSYALSELLMLGVPPVATRMGSFPERIRDRETGYLFAPEAGALVDVLREINLDRATLARIRRDIAGWRPRSAEEMVADYHRILPLAAPAAAPAAAVAPPPAAEVALMAGLWKHIRSLDLQLALVNDARHRTEMRRLAEQRELDAVQDRLQRFGAEIAQREAQVLQKDMQLQHLARELNRVSAMHAEMRASTSWRLTAPLRLVGAVIKHWRALADLAARAARDPAWRAEQGAVLRVARREGGWPGVRRALSAMRDTRGADAWHDYRRAFEAEVRPLLLGRVDQLARKPLVSIIVPTYDPVEDMLRQMLDSVRAQIYPYWELCVADDGSREPYVRRILQEYAALDRRIKVHIGGGNRGVSHASNRALEMATGDFVVLLDHDDLLEEQALFRVAESIVADDPDMLYSDEALVTPDGNSVRRYAYRPAFSLEYLRSHPYIVHLAGFRTQLLRQLGGWDEALSISQDYDLVLRVAERARTIVHVPEILYRWRIHGSSAGIGKQDQVMATSKEVLRRHLERCGEAGEVHDGASFNLFDVRYPLRAGLRVAIIIPTRNHGELLRQCIDSIRATAGAVAYDIVVVDHESDEPATLEYLAAIAPGVRVRRYEGPFNFAAINNWAVASLEGDYTHYLLCNNDIEAYEPGWLERLLELGQQPGIGIVGAKLFYPDRKTIQHAGVGVGLFGAAEHYGKRIVFPGEPVEPGYGELLLLSHEVSAVTAACLLVRKDAFAAAAGFDEAIAVGFGDVDLCLRVLQSGYRVVFCPHARLAHHESFTRGVSPVDPHPADSSLYRIKWKEMLQAGDPFYNPGLSSTSTRWEVRQPLRCSADLRRRVARLDRDAARAYVEFSPAPGTGG